MLIFKDLQNKVHQLDRAEFTHLLPEGCQQISEQEAADLLAPTPEQIKAELVMAVQGHLDTVASGHGYDSIFSACTYADEPAVAQFQTEGQALRAWRSLVWAHCHQVMADVMAAQRAVPAAEELIAELPALVMP